MFPGSLAICPIMPVYEAILGTNVSLGVSVSGQPPVRAEEIDWRYPWDRWLPHTLKFAHLRLADNNRTLHIRDVGIIDAGIYRIHLNKRIIGNNYLNVTASIELNVKGKCRIGSIFTVPIITFVRVRVGIVRSSLESTPYLPRWYCYPSENFSFQATSYLSRLWCFFCVHLLWYSEI